MTGSSSPRCSRSAPGSATCATVAIRSGSRPCCTASTTSRPWSRPCGWRAMFDPDSARSPGSVSVRPPRTWDFMETLFVVLLADAVYFVTATLALLVMLRMQENAGSLSRAQLHALWTQGNWYGVALVVGCLSAIVVIWIAVRMAGRDFTEYLALNWPSGREIASAFGIMACL